MTDHVQVTGGILDDDGKLAQLVVEQEDHRTRTVDVGGASLGTGFVMMTTQNNALPSDSDASILPVTNRLWYADPDTAPVEALPDWATADEDNGLLLAGGMYAVTSIFYADGAYGFEASLRWPDWGNVLWGFANPDAPTPSVALSITLGVKEGTTSPLQLLAAQVTGSAKVVYGDVFVVKLP